MRTILEIGINPLGKRVKKGFALRLTEALQATSVWTRPGFDIFVDRCEVCVCLNTRDVGQDEIDQALIQMRGELSDWRGRISALGRFRLAETVPPEKVLKERWVWAFGVGKETPRWFVCLRALKRLFTDNPKPIWGERLWGR